MENEEQDDKQMQQIEKSNIQSQGLKQSNKQIQEEQQNQKQKPCNNCKSCIQFTGESHPDFMQIEPEEGKTVKIEQIRFLQEKIAEKPVTSNKKVYVIENAETMTREAANALLKTLEEPPEYAVLILLTSNESKLLTTIKSRCTKIYFMGIQEEQILAYLKQNGLETDITESMIKSCMGSIGKALKLEEEKDQYLQIEELAKAIPKNSITEIWRKAEVLYKAKENAISLLEYMNIVFYELLKKQNKVCYANGIKVIEQVKQRILANANYDMSIDYLLLKLKESIC